MNAIRGCLVKGVLGACSFLLLPPAAEAAFFCRHPSRPVYYYRTYPQKTVERHYYPTPSAKEQAGPSERYYYPRTERTAPPSLWQPGDGDPPLTHTFE